MNKSNRPLMTPPAAPRRAQTLRRSERLLHSLSFKKVLRGGRCFRHPLLRVHFLESKHALSRLGLVVSRKVGNAVVRNLVKRRLREVFRRDKHWLAQPLDVVFIAEPGRGAGSLKEFEAAFAQFLKYSQAPRAKPSRTASSPGDPAP